MNPAQILGALAAVRDPYSGQAIRVENLQIQGVQVTFTVVLASLASEKKQELTFACIAAVQAVYADADVHVHLQMRAAQATESDSSVPQIKNIIAIGSGKGGVGKSTVAANLAIALRELGARVGLMDADLYGPSIPTMFGLQGERPNLRDVYGTTKIVPLEAHGIPLMSIGFIIEPEAAVVLRGPRLGSIIKQFFNDCLWPELDFLLIDLPPGTGDVQLTLVQTVPLTGVVLVTTPQEVALIDAIKAMNMFQLPQVNVPILGVIENMSWFTPAELPENKYYLFGKDGGKTLAKRSNSVLLAQVPLVQSIRESGDMGMPIVSRPQETATADAFREAAKKLLQQVAVRNEMLPPTNVIEVQR